MYWRSCEHPLAFLPSAILGFLLIDNIEAMLESALVVAWALIVGGIAIILIERFVGEGKLVGVAELPVNRALGIGLIQCLSMIPGVSRSGATILGALSLGVERRTAAEFSFFLAIPTMSGATLHRTSTTGFPGAGGIASAYCVGPGQLASRSWW